MGFANHKFIQLWARTSARSSGFQLPERGILRISINNLVIKREIVDKLLCILNISWENKKKSWWCFVYKQVDDLNHQDFFAFPLENKKH